MSDIKDTRFTTELFKDKESAEKAYKEALEHGYKEKEINVIMSEDSKRKYYDSILVKTGTKTTEGLGAGSAAGATIGGIVAALAAVGTSLVVPGLGLIVAGPLAAGLAGAGAGSIAGGLIGALIGWGIPEEKAKVFEAGINSGGIILGLHENLPNSNLQENWKKYR